MRAVAVGPIGPVAVGSILQVTLGIAVLGVMLAALVHLGVLLRDDQYRKEQGGVGAFVFALVFFPLAPLIWLGPYFGYIRPKRVDRRLADMRARFDETIAATPHDGESGIDMASLGLLDRLAQTRTVLRSTAVIGLVVGFGSIPFTKAGSVLDVLMPISIVLFIGGLVAVGLLVGLMPSNTQQAAFAFEQFAALNGFGYDPSGSADPTSTRARTLLGSLAGVLPEAAVSDIVTGQLADGRPFSRCTFTGNDLAMIGGWGLGSFYTLNVMTLELEDRSPHILIDCHAETGQTGDPSLLVGVAPEYRRRLDEPYGGIATIDAVSEIDPATQWMVASLLRTMGAHDWYCSIEIIDKRLHLYAPGIEHPADWFERSFAYANDASSIVARAAPEAQDIVLMPRRDRRGARQLLYGVAVIAFVVAFFTGAQRGGGWSIAAVVALVVAALAYGRMAWLSLRRRINARQAREVLVNAPWPPEPRAPATAEA